ncbi:hypothetical protein SAMN05216378_5803 [Paenibacillus catalpae]|uniref:Uncharacterized protein n=1 Tax=Paenibacillus catalpae TaxID=1045775 RepID=A0A1I2HHB3_9BACL|nr:hypothetical protein SAMN05216378_5803 [Paenibacillus catalpae]
MIVLQTAQNYGGDESLNRQIVNGYFGGFGRCVQLCKL